MSRLPRVAVIPTAHMKCPCCARERAFKIMYHASSVLKRGVQLLDVRQFCDCKIEDETLKFLCERAAREHHEGVAA